MSHETVVPSEFIRRLELRLQNVGFTSEWKDRICTLTRRDFAGFWIDLSDGPSPHTPGTAPCVKVEMAAFYPNNDETPHRQAVELKVDGEENVLIELIVLNAVKLAEPSVKG